MNRGERKESKREKARNEEGIYEKSVEIMKKRGIERNRRKEGRREGGRGKRSYHIRWGSDESL